MAFTTSSGSSVSVFLNRSAIDRIKLSRLIFVDKRSPLYRRDEFFRTKGRHDKSVKEVSAQITFSRIRQDNNNRLPAHVPENIRVKARKTLDRMLEINGN